MYPRGRGEPHEDGCLFHVICCAGLFPCLHDGYECSINVLIGEKISKFLFCRFLEWLVALSGKRYITTIFTWFTSSTRLHPPTFASFFIFFNLSKAYNSAVPNAAIIYTVSLSCRGIT